MKENWKKNIALFLSGQAVTLFGSSLVQYAIIWYISIETQSGIMATLITICAFAPQVVISIFAGVWADRFSRKKLIIFSDGGIALSTLMLAMLMMKGVNSMWLLLVISAIRSVGAGIQTPSVNAVIPQLVPEDKLMRINGINGTIQSIVGLAAPAASGAILMSGPIWNVMLIDVVTAIIGIGVLLFVPISVITEDRLPKKGGYLDDLAAGLRYSFKNKFILQLLIISGLFMILMCPAAMLNVLMVTRTFGGYWHLTMNEVIYFVGAFAGGIMMATWGGFENRVATLTVGTVLFGIFTVAMGLTYTFWVYLIFICIVGFSMPMVTTPFLTLLQEKSEPEMQGRVFGISSIIFSAFAPLAMVFFGPLAEVVSIQTLMIITGIGLVLLGLTVFIRKDFYKAGVKKRPEQ